MDKFRACGDLKRSLTNLSCAAHDPVQLVSRDHIDQLSHVMSNDRGDWVTFKAHREDAYKHLPTAPVDMSTDIVALRHTAALRWGGFIARTLIFGPIASAIRYNSTSRILVTLAFRCLGFTLEAYCGDSAAIIRKIMGDADLKTFARFCSLLGPHLKPGKSILCSPTAPLGLTVEFPPNLNGREISISLPPENRRSWALLIEYYEAPVFRGGPNCCGGVSSCPGKYIEIGAYFGQNSPPAGRPIAAGGIFGDLSKRGRHTAPLTRKRPSSSLSVLY